MSPRRFVAASALSLLACRMDNPAFEAGDELGEASSSAESGSETSSTGAMSESASEIGETEVGESDSSETSPGDTSECVEGEPCGDCHVCDALGECIPDAGALCGEAECANHIYGLVEDLCHSFDNQLVPKVCTEQGECKPQLDRCSLIGDPLCDIDCALSCNPLAPAEGACILAGEGPGCVGTDCDGLDTVLHYSCEQGFCESTIAEVCGGGTICDAGMCVPLP